MKKKLLITIGKWIIMGVLISINLISYIITNSYLNLALSLIIVAYSIYEFFKAISIDKMNMGFKIYLFTFYMMAMLCLALGVRSFVSGYIGALVVCVVLIAGDVVFIIYNLNKIKSLTSK